MPAIKDKAEKAGTSVAETARQVGLQVAAGAEKAGRGGKNVDIAGIREHMPVIASCGQRIGTVDRIEGRSIKLTKSAPAAHGEHRYIPLEWVESVTDNVRLNRNSEEAEREWREEPIDAGA